MGALCLLGWDYGKEPNPKELFNLGIKSYKEQDFSQAKEYFEKRLDAIMLKIMLECLGLIFVKEWI
ncbi:beta-lactamase HcpA [Helicobacter pylori CPY6081]|nr:beta-lactamase HcpA [Helicobacter pylori CPY6081]